MSFFQNLSTDRILYHWVFLPDRFVRRNGCGGRASFRHRNWTEQFFCAEYQYWGKIWVLKYRTEGPVWYYLLSYNSTIQHGHVPHLRFCGSPVPASTSVSVLASTWCRELWAPHQISRINASVDFLYWHGAFTAHWVLRGQCWYLMQNSELRRDLDILNHNPCRKSIIRLHSWGFKEVCFSYLPGNQKRNYRSEMEIHCA